MRRFERRGPRAHLRVVFGRTTLRRVIFVRRGAGAAGSEARPPRSYGIDAGGIEEQNTVSRMW